MAERVEALVAAVEPVVAALGYRLYDVELAGSGRTRTLRVAVDRDGGVDLTAITEVTEALSPVLDHAAHPEVAAALRAPYTLEVSSPGLERPLRTPAHFQGALGSTISLKHRDADGSTVRRRGVLTGADDTGVDLDVDGEQVRVPYDEVIQSRTVFEWADTAKPERRRARTKTKQKAAS
jgi:ribosome maturation factor RimP